MNLKNIKFVPILIRYILPFFEIYLFKIVDEMLRFQAISNQIDANDAVIYFKYIIFCIFITSCLVMWKYRSILAFILQLFVFFVLFYCISLNESINYRIPH